MRGNMLAYVGAVARGMKYTAHAGMDIFGNGFLNSRNGYTIGNRRTRVRYTLRMMKYMAFYGLNRMTMHTARKF